ncbi:MAG: hypothetical protein WC575_03160 [Patescibacteria group bacterium]
MKDLPKLKIVKICELCLHETVDPCRVLRLKKLINQADLFTNPPIVSYISSIDKYLVLDGANRTTCLRELGFKYILVQVVEYIIPEVNLLTWNHFISKISLKQIIGNTDGMNFKKVKSVSIAKSSISKGYAVAYLTDGRSIYIANCSSSFNDKIFVLNSIVEIYKGKYSFNRVLEDDYRELKKEYPSSTVLFVFNKFFHHHIVKVVKLGLFVPSGITRHIIQGRALRVDIPMEWLYGKYSLMMVNSKLQKMIHARISFGKIRYYNEPTFIFND